MNNLSSLLHGFRLSNMAIIRHWKQGGATVKSQYVKPYLGFELYYQFSVVSGM